jgi:hypothetical protein
MLNQGMKKRTFWSMLRVPHKQNKRRSVMSKHTQIQPKEQENASAYVQDLCYQFLLSLLVTLDAYLDRRLVETFLGLVLVILMHRHRNQGLLLSELGGHLLNPGQAPAGTKRISNLLHSPNWSSQLVEDYLWQQGDQRVVELQQQKETVLVVWDESVLEKPESLQLENLSPVRSTKAVRLKRIKPGFYNPPGGRPIFVPGYHWLQILVLGMTGTPVLAHLGWWATRGKQARPKRELEAELLTEICQRWGLNVLHVWDRGFAGNPWLTLAYLHAVPFVLRWPKGYQLVDEQDQERKAWEITRGKRSWESRRIWDAHRHCFRDIGVYAAPVFDKVHRQPLWLVVARPGKGREPWYLLTNQPVHTAQQAWRIVLAYARRWQVEMSLRFDKCELGFESPRLRKWETQLRLLLIASLAFAFLLSLLRLKSTLIVPWLLRHWCHRTGEWSRMVRAPLYRLRLALSSLWSFYPPPFLGFSTLNSG